jgi:(p)ppGpp synthase/HD superfamily hydrolase
MTATDHPTLSVGGVAIAQTVTALFQQLQRQRLTDQDLLRVRGAYALAMKLFAGRIHPTGKPYIAHCVGVASTLACVGAHMDLIVAGILHGVYRQGDLGPWRVFLRWQRPIVRRAVGDAVENYVHRFHRASQDVDALNDIRRRLDPIDTTERDVLLLVLANELDNWRDRGVLSCVDASARRLTLLRKGGLFADIAGKLGYPALAMALTRVVEETAAADVAPGHHWRQPGVSLSPPASARRRLGARIAGAFAAAARRTLRARDGRH